MSRFMKSDDVTLDLDEAKKFISGSSSNNKPNVLQAEEPVKTLHQSVVENPWDGLNPDAPARITYQLRFNDYYKEALDQWAKEAGQSKHHLLMPLIKDALDAYIKK